MSLSITSTAPPAQAPKAAASGGSSQQQAQLDQLVTQYKTDISRKASADVLASLARQIAVASKALGQTVVLPKASGETSAPPSTAHASQPTTEDPGDHTGAAGGKVSVTT
jgi:hypothetical protein